MTPPVAAVMAFALAALLTPLVKGLATRAGLVAHPRNERWHRAPVSLMGGVAIVGAFVATMVAAPDRTGVVALLACSAGMFVVGLADDLWGFRPLVKLGAQVAIALAWLLAAPAVNLTALPLVDQIIALAWIVGLTNAFNLLDNVDGLAAGVAAIAAGFYVAVMWPVAAGPVLIALAAFLGAAAGFLVYNFPPASIFMGDCGSLFLGFFLSGMGLLVAAQAPVGSASAIPILILFLPIFDTSFVTLTRLMAGRSPLVGGRDHLSHRLIALGFPERRAILVHYVVTAGGGLIALAVLHAAGAYVGIALGLYAIGIAAFGIVLGHVESAHAQAGGSPAAATGLPLLLSEISYRNRALEALLDASLAGLAYYVAFAVRFQGEEFSHFLPYFAGSLPIVVVCQVTGLWISGKYRHVWRSFGAAELTTILKGVLLGVAVAVIVVLYLYRFEGFSRLVFAIDSVVLLTLLIGARVAVNRLDEHLLKQRGRDRRVIVYGAGRRGALLVRDLLQASQFNLVPVGFLDDDPAKRRLRIEGLRVFGTLDDLDATLAKHAPSEVVVSTARVDATRLRAIDRICRARNVRVRLLHLALEDLTVSDLGGMARHG
jgi:UDP-GlcNAc:undecaprenyl-phosphate GlcNAc-1-phosphate transferase